MWGKDLLNNNFGKVKHWPPSTVGIFVFSFVIVILLEFSPTT